MGLTSLDNTPRLVPGVRPEQGPRRDRETGADSPGSLHAMMLDMKRTFDEIVEAHADPDRAAQILAKPVLPVAVIELRRHAGIHGHGEAWPAPGGPTSGT